MINDNIKFKKDIDFIFSKINDNGGELWSSIDKKVWKGTPFSTRDVSIMLIDLGYTKNNQIIKDIAELFFSLQKKDGRFKISPSGAIYPCHTIGVLRILCNMGYHDDSRLQKTFDYLLDTQQSDGGWKCNKYIFGRGIDKEFSNPGPTLEALEAFRYLPDMRADKRINKAVEFLLWHWEIKKPIGPCQYGIGSLFKKTEYPLLRYNIFHFCYTLSFYKSAVIDNRYNEALSILKNKMIDGKIIVENTNKKIEFLDFCKKGQPSDLATKKYDEIIENINKKTLPNSRYDMQGGV